LNIGILTYHRSHNYGALLQAYALQTYLKKIGHNAEMIDYWPEYHAQDYQVIPYFSAIKVLSKIKLILLLIIGFNRIIKRSEGYKRFIREYFNLTDIPLYTDENSMGNIAYDVVVYGSDQIWRKSNYSTFKGYSDIYFGLYPEKVTKKITYAASMGVIDLVDKDKIYIRKMLKNYFAISVREENLKKIVEEIIEKPVSLVLDPVFLLDKAEWLTLSSTLGSKIHEKYIFFYQLTPSQQAIDFINKLKAYYGYKVIEIRGRVEPLLFGKRYYQTATPNDFISLIQNAEIVVSTSFHGIAFSIIFNKQFYALGMGNNSQRVKSMLNLLGIKERYLDKINKNMFTEQINYENIKNKLDYEIEKSKKYLCLSIN